MQIRGAALMQRSLSLLVLALILAACMPELNWRETSPPESGFVVLMPGKPDRMSRDINLNGLNIKMHMVGSKVDPVSYTVAWVKTDSAAQAQRAAQAMRLGMLKNLGQLDQPGRPVLVRIKPAPGQETGGEPTKIAALAIELKPQGKDGSAGSAKVQGTVAEQAMSAYFVAYGNQAWQAVVLGKAIDAEAAKQFLDSFQLLAQ